MLEPDTTSVAAAMGPLPAGSGRAHEPHDDGTHMSQDTPDLTPADRGATAAGGPAPTGATALTPAPARPTDAGTSVGDRFDTTSDDLVVREAARPSLWARLGAEALGTFALVLVGGGVALYAPLSQSPSLGTAVAFAFALTGAAVALGHVSGGHFNPAVTFGAVVAGRAPVRDLVPYWLAQLVGGALAAAALFVTIPSELPGLLGQEGRRSFFSTSSNGYGEHSPLSTLSQGQVTFDLLPALLVELVATALLVAVVLGATSRRVSNAVAAVAFGLTYGALVLLTAPITGAGLNPARSTATAVFSEGWALEQLWVFWVAPLVGAAIAGLAHRAFAVDAGQQNLLEEDDLVVDEDSLLDDGVDDVTVSPRL